MGTIKANIDAGLEIKPKEVLDAVKSYRSVGFWAKIISAALVAVAGISFTAAKLATAFDESAQKPDIEQISESVEDLKDIIESHLETDADNKGESNDPS